MIPILGEGGVVFQPQCYKSWMNACCSRMIWLLGRIGLELKCSGLGAPHAGSGEPVY
jgi:hypothetical protein